MRRLSGTALSIRLFLGLGFAQGSSPAPGSIRGDVFPKGTNGEPAVLPDALIVLRGPTTRETESDEKRAFAIDGPPPGTYQIEATVLELYAVKASAGRSSTVPVEMNALAVTRATSPQMTRLKAMDCAFSRRVHHDA